MTTDLARVRALRDNYLAYFRLFHSQHGIRVHEDAETAWIIANGPPGNHLLRTTIQGSQPDARLQAILQEIARWTGGMRWLVFPFDAPQDMAARLRALGLHEDEGDVWMFRDLEHLPALTLPPGFRVEVVADLPTLRRWWTVSAQGFGMRQKMAQVWYDAYRRHGFGPGAYALHVIGWAGREPVASASLILAAGIAGVYDVSTAPWARRRGYARAVTLHLLHLARERGYHVAGLQTHDAIELYENLGFTVGWREKEFVWAAPSS
ncbi:MAG: GNAT family N-acetyltransferase [Caldilineae bacterium]|nr:MAG: GNAT family N-acetyltransferase [Caldilineae bacterium]